MLVRPSLYGLTNITRVAFKGKRCIMPPITGWKEQWWEVISSGYTNLEPEINTDTNVDKLCQWGVWLGF